MYNCLHPSVARPSEIAVIIDFSQCSHVVKLLLTCPTAFRLAYPLADQVIVIESSLMRVATFQY